MRLILTIFLIFIAGWTLSAQACTLLGLNLKALLNLAPFVIAALLGAYFLLPATTTSISRGQELVGRLKRSHDKQLFPIMLGLVFLLPISLYWSWIAFWYVAVLLLGLCLIPRNSAVRPETFVGVLNSKRSESLIVGLCVVAAVVLSYWVSRSDLDDAFYVAVAAFSSSNPEHSLLATDPMLGETSFPLIFPSYRFSSFELLSGAIGYLLSVPAMDVYYIYLLPLWVVATVVAVFLLTRELIPRHWLLAGILALFLTLFLGEMHRSPANFSFVRLFQGKAVFLSVIVPSIFYLTGRFFSERGTDADLILLACCQIASIGLTNFGMLAAPIAGFSALISNIPLAIRKETKKLYSASAILLVPLPYLIAVALQANGSPIMNFENETAANVFTSVFGKHQQYLVGLLLVAGPVLAKNTVTTWRLAVPPLLLLGIYLNPWLSSLVSKYVTTPPVYWRVVWSFPILVYAAISLSLIAVELLERKTSRLFIGLLAAIVLGLTVRTFPLNTLRVENVEFTERFASWKVPDSHLVVAQKAARVDNAGGRLLAPDEIAGLISRFEQHPRLVSTRGLYLDLLRHAIGEDSYRQRRVLYDLVTGKPVEKADLVRLALRSLEVSIIVVHLDNEYPQVISLFESEGYKCLEVVNRYSIWKRTNLCYQQGCKIGDDLPKLLENAASLAGVYTIARKALSLLPAGPNFPGHRITFV